MSPKYLAARVPVRIQMPAVLLVALLQRSPVLQLARLLTDEAITTPCGNVLRCGAMALVTLGAIDSLAGATVFTLQTNFPGPVTEPVNVPLQPIAFGISPDQAVIGLWKIGGNIPPGLTFRMGSSTTSAPDTLFSNSGVQNPSLSGTPTTPGTYSMTLEALDNYQGTTFSSGVFTYVIVVSPPASLVPAVTSQPSSQTVAAGGTVVFRCIASGTPSYQWLFNNSPLADGPSAGTTVSGSLGSALMIRAVGAGNAGSYSCVATNSSGTVTSNAATLNVSATTNPGRLVNISARAQVGTGGNIIFAGFVVGPSGNSGTLPVLVRASGPAIAAAPFSVPGTLADPQLQLFSGPTLTETNNGWGGDVGITATASAVGAFTWGSASSHDSAFDLALVPGAYTAQVAGQAGDTGDALVEVYDATPSGTYTPAMPRLVNLAARVNVGTGGNALFAGFVINGSTSLTVLIRASGPAIAVAPFSVPGTLPDPQLTLQNQASTVLASNVSWGGDPVISSVSADVGAFGWNDPTSHDSALLVTLPPGAYTAAVVGTSGDTGVAIVEVYEVQ